MTANILHLILFLAILVIQPTSTSMYDVATFGDIFADVVIAGPEKNAYGQVETLADTYAVELGGSGPIFASQFTKLGGSVALLTIVGEDPLGDFTLNRLTEIGIDTSLVSRSQNRDTPLGLNISVKGDRSMMTVLGTLEEITPEIIPSGLLDNIRHWHIAGYFLLPGLLDFWPGFLRELKQKGITCSLDTNWAPGGNWEQVLEILPLVDLFFPNEEEAMAISGKSSYSEAGMALDALGPLIVMKRGEHGAAVFQDGDEWNATNEDHWQEKIEVLDTTGAGDSFDGGFLFEWLNGSELDLCLATGIKCGISNVGGIGGIQSQYSKTT